ncbi:uncharacterized protein LOC115432255 [Sphaeramia orbicularis]|uniref:Uncharacterized LOC115432255 n=1 Tax=Sphaeramia orbicularis TaxID=375764 RepID=A0A673A1H4_9TELE|nr:uncharacterized protein LOC115432255 [Sphaeramia orbicularis]
MAVHLLLMFLLFHALVLTAAQGRKDVLYVQSAVGGDSILPCARPGPASGCSSITWTFYKAGEVRYSVEVSGGKMRKDSDKSGRMSLTSDCSLDLQDLRVEDSGSYVCMSDMRPVADVYLSILTVSSPSAVTELRPGGHLVLSCVLHTFYDAGSCKSYSSVFTVSWVAEDGTALTTDGRYQLMEHSRCNVTLWTRLRADDHGRRWRCQANHTALSRLVSMDVTTSFLLGSVEAPVVSALQCPLHLPVSRIVLCATLPIMVLMVALFTWRTDRKQNQNRKKETAAGIKLQGI